MNTDIYKMKLHETIQQEGMQIMRVASGWIYSFISYNGFESASVFVPFDNHFQESK